MRVSVALTIDAATVRPSAQSIVLELVCDRATILKMCGPRHTCTLSTHYQHIINTSLTHRQHITATSFKNITKNINQKAPNHINTLLTQTITIAPNKITPTCCSNFCARQQCSPHASLAQPHCPMLQPTTIAELIANVQTTHVTLNVHGLAS